jgi:ribosomal-protein-alanine N-acetyltransferase
MTGTNSTESPAAASDEKSAAASEEKSAAASIVAMTQEHIPELMRYEEDMFGAESWSADAYREELADTRYRRYVAAVDADGVLLGWAGIRMLGKEAEILTVGVIPTARRAGLGTRLVQTLLDEARSRAVRDVFLDVRVDNEQAQRVYEREGFTGVGVRRGYYDSGRTDALTMALRNLAAPATGRQ